MRAFFIQNETGARVGLNGEGGIRLTEPTGLGISFSTEYTDIEEGFFMQTKRKEPQGKAAGTLNFTKNAYARYQEFIDWCMRAKRLYLIYKPLKSEYFREVEISYLTKTELNRVKWLEIPAAFSCLTPWYLPTPLALNFEGDEDTAMRYEFSYDDKLVYGESGGGVYSVEIPARGHVPAALRVRYTGAAADLEISLTGVESGTEYGKCAISGSIGATEILELFTAKRSGYIKSIAADGTETDLLDAGRVDISTEPFFRAPVHEASILKLTGAGTLTGKVSAQAYFYYRSV